MNNNISETNLYASSRIHQEYDHYLSFKKATACYIYLEEEIILNEVKQLPSHKRNIAIDMGCGTGRVSVLLNQYFQKLIAIDLSEEMLLEAKEKCYVNKPNFIKHDFNEGLERFLCSYLEINFICASFGVGSCIENLDYFLKLAVSMISDGSVMVLSFYNKNYQAITEDKQDLPFLSMLNTRENWVMVNHESECMPIKIMSYTEEELKVLTEKYHFSRRQFYFLPTVSGLIRSDFFQDQQFLEKIIAIDRSLLHYANTVSAPYILLVLVK